MAEEEQFKILLQLLRKFQRARILNDLMLIGSWCLQFYRYHFERPETLPAFRTLDGGFPHTKSQAGWNGSRYPQSFKGRRFRPHL